MGLNGGRRGVPVGEALTHGIGEFLVDVCECDRFEVRSVYRLAGGAVQENYVLDAQISGGAFDGPLELVVRVDAPCALPASLPRSLEFEVLRTAWEVGVTVPEPLWLCLDEARIGRSFFVMRRLPGTAAGHRLVRDQSLDADRLLARLGTELARVHAVRSPFPGLEDLPAPDISAGLSRVYQYRGYLDELPEPQPTLEWGLGWLERHAASEEGELSLCHGDFRTGNFLVEGGELSGILDWEFASWGDPLEDLGWFFARCWRFGRWDHDAGGLGDRETLLLAYETASEVRVDREILAYWEVMAAVRWAILALQQAQRGLGGAERSLELALTGRMVPEMELDLLMQIEQISDRAQ